MTTPTDRRAALVNRLDDAIGQMEASLADWAQIASLPVLEASQRLFIDLMKDCRETLLAAPPSPEPEKELQREVCGVRLRVRGWLTVTCDLVAGHDYAHEGGRSGERVWFDESGCGALPAGPRNPLRCDSQPTPEDVAALRAQIATLTRERDEARTALDTERQRNEDYFAMGRVTADVQRVLQAAPPTPGGLSASMDNVLAWRLGEVANQAVREPSGDLIDRGLALRRLLEKAGFLLQPAPVPPAPQEKP